MAKKSKKENKTASGKKPKKGKKVTVDRNIDTVGITNGDMKSHIRAAFLNRPH